MNKILVASLLAILSVVFLLAMSTIKDNTAFATGKGLSVVMDGYFNVAEKFYRDGGFSYEYYLFVNNGTNGQTRYALKFENANPSALFHLSGKNVHVNGYMNSNSAKYSKFSSNANVMDVESITPSQNNAKSSNISRNAGVFVSPIDSVTILLKFSDVSAEPHTSGYFQERFYGDVSTTTSLNAYFYDTSYGALSLSGQVVNWKTLAKSTTQYRNEAAFFGDTTALQDAITAADSSVNFNGIEQVLLVFNDDLPDGCGCAFAYFDPLQISTGEGTKSVLVEFIPDGDFGFAVDTSYLNGVGVVAHEMGHNLGWDHTPPPTGIDVYADPWSLMSKAGDFVSNGPVGATAFNRNEESWIPAADVKTISSGQQETFSLDVLNDPSPGPNFLMGKIPFTVTAFGVSIPSGTSTHGCELIPLCYNPYRARIQIGDTITWTNNDSVTHRVVSSTGIFNSGDIISGQTFSRTFNSAGVFDYFCTIHPWMSGVVEVLSGSHQDNFYTIEARKDTPTFDETPQDQMGIVMYNVSPTGHPSTPSESFSEANIVDTTGTGDWDNADLDVGFTYADLTNRIYITSLSQTSTTITVNVQSNPPCLPPASGDWYVVANCTMSSNAAVTGDVIVQNNAILTIQNNVSLDIDFIQHHLLVKSGSGVLVQAGGKIF